MCGRLRFGKSFVDFLAHCWSELPCVRPLDAAQIVAAGRNALRGSGPGHKLALEAPGAKWVVPFHGPTGVGAYKSPALTNDVHGAWAVYQFPAATGSIL